MNCRLDTLNGAIDGASLVRMLEELSDICRSETIVVIAPAPCTAQERSL